MAIKYEKMSRTALKLIVGNGRPVTFVQINKAAADPNEKWKGSQNLPDTLIEATALFIDPVSEKDLGRQLLIGPAGVKEGTEICFVAAAENLDQNGIPVDLTKVDRMMDNGVVYEMDEIHVLKPGPVVLMYEFRVIR